ncbi:MAG: hypothetical protein PSX37_09200 [bacterium]|nr:hypothetical protein [bacterium]
MSINATDLLKKLAGVSGTPARSNAAGLTDGAAFAGMLAKATSTQAPESGIPVTVEPFAGVELNAGQLERVARAADLAEREGATRAMVLIDDQMLMMDVTTRTITGKADPSSQVLTGLDAVVRVPPAGSNESGPVIGLPGKGMLGVSPSLLTALSGSSDSQED